MKPALDCSEELLIGKIKGVVELLNSMFDQAQAKGFTIEIDVDQKISLLGPSPKIKIKVLYDFMKKDESPRPGTINNVCSWAKEI